MLAVGGVGSIIGVNAETDAMEAQSVLTLSLTCDNRVLDHFMSAELLQEVCEGLEQAAGS